MNIESLIHVLIAGIFSASSLFLLSAGLQIVYGVQKIFNIACGTIFALGAYMGITFVDIFLNAGFSKELFLIPLILGGLSLAFIGPAIERGLLRFIYGRDIHFQLLMFFALTLIMEDSIRMIWGISPKATRADLYSVYGLIDIMGSQVPVYHFIVILAGGIIAAATRFILVRTRFGKIIRATADNGEMVEALGINRSNIGVKVFTFGTVLGTLGGALVIPITTANPDMGVDLLLLAFAVVVIGGLGTITGALVGALVVGVLKALTVMFFPEMEIFLLYFIVIGILVLKPEGLFGKSNV